MTVANTKKNTFRMIVSRTIIIEMSATTMIIMTVVIVKKGLRTDTTGRILFPAEVKMIFAPGHLPLGGMYLQSNCSHVSLLAWHWHCARQMDLQHPRPPNTRYLRAYTYNYYTISQGSVAALHFTSASLFCCFHFFCTPETTWPDREVL
jgi:hypothetical protein